MRKIEMVNLQMWRDNDNFQLYDSIHTLKIYRNGEIYLYGISFSEWLFEMHQIPNINVLELSKYFETEMLKSKCCWNPGWWYLMLLRKVSRYIGLKWTVFTFSSVKWQEIMPWKESRKIQSLSSITLNTVIWF